MRVTHTINLDYCSDKNDTDVSKYFSLKMCFQIYLKWIDLPRANFQSISNVDRNESNVDLILGYSYSPID
jgi:hypothetical protein